MSGSRARAAAAALCLAAACARPEVAHEARPSLLLLITVDTLRADRLGAYGSARGLTPRLDALAARSIVFTAAYAPASFTVPSLAALMTGRYPEEIGISTNESALPDAVPTLASVLETHGWHTAAVVSNWVLRRGTGLERGFARYDDSYPDLEAVRKLPERRAPATTEAALAALARCPEPCFLWVHYQDPHGPYTPPERLRARYLARERGAPDGRRRLPVQENSRERGGIPSYQRIGGEREVAFYRSGYDGEVRYLDVHVGRLIAALAARGRAERAVIVFTADHGESLGEDDYWFAHGALLSDVLVRVPLLVRLPGAGAARRDDLTSLVDLVPTLLPLLTGKPATGDRPGRDLLAPHAPARPSTPYLDTLGGDTTRRRAIVDGDYKYIVEDRDSREHARLLRRGEDVEVDAAPEVRARLSTALQATRASLRRTAETRQILSPAARERLRALGYADD